MEDGEQGRIYLELGTLILIYDLDRAIRYTKGDRV